MTPDHKQAGIERDGSVAATRPTRIIFTPWQEHDGQWHTKDEIVEAPNAVELDGPWLHIVAYEGATRARRLLRSLPAHIIEGIVWDYDRG